MSDTQSTGAAETTATETTETTTATEQLKPTETVEFWKQKAREQEKRAKDNADAAKRLSEFEESQKTEQQKLTDRLAAAEKDAADARAETMRHRIAMEFQLSTEDASALEEVTSEDGMRRIAERLSKSTSDRKKNGNHVPKEGTTTTAAPGDERAFVRELFGAG